MSDQSPSAITERMMALGDPSGRQDAGYWDSWFRIVSSQESSTRTTTSSTFEWYCRPEEVVRVVSHHRRHRHHAPSLLDVPGSDISTTSNGRRMIHPGSGTSQVPRMLAEAFPGHPQVIVDVSEVAVDLARKSLLEGGDSSSSNNDQIKFLIADILDPPLPFESSSFFCWVDKGFVDAVFAVEGHDDEKVEKLFAEIQRLLIEDGGFALIISLAEDHSLRIILDSWLRRLRLGCWSSDLHVWEMEPVSGDLRPFGFVLTTSSSSSSGDEENLRIVWHFTDGKSTTFTSTSKNLLETVRDQVSRSRQVFSETNAKTNSSRKVLACIEVKPDDTDVDLEALAARIIAKTNWGLEEGSKYLQVSWQPVESTGDRNDPKLYQIIPIGYGVSKLNLKCVIDPEDLEEMVAVMEEEFIGVQSVDVDWHNTVPVGDTRDFVLRV